MFYAIGIVICLVVASYGGYAVLMALTSLPLIGSWIEWYANYVPVYGTGVTANLVYAAMAMQVIVTMLGVVFYGPGAVVKLAKFAKSKMQPVKAAN